MLLRERKALRDMKQDREFFSDEVPLACTLTGSEQVTRNEEVGELFKDVLQVNELADGYALRFPGSDGWANKLVQFITFERGCCPFFTFELAFEPEQGPIWLHLRGPEGVKAMIENMLATAQYGSNSPCSWRSTLNDEIDGAIPGE
jgi:hypothetical protein